MIQQPSNPTIIGFAPLPTPTRIQRIPPVWGIEDFMTNFEQGVQAVKHEAKQLKWIERGATDCVKAVGVLGIRKHSPSNDRSQ